MIGMKKLRRYDLYAPSASKIKEKNYPYDKSVKLVFESLEKFSPKLSSFAKNVFEKNHIDSSIRPGKEMEHFAVLYLLKLHPMFW